MKYEQVKPGDEYDACDDQLDDHHTERLIFFADDQGNWYTKVHTDHGAYSSAVLFRISDDEAFNEELLRILDAARELGRST